MTLYMVGYSTPPLMLTLEKLNVRRDWIGLHPEVRRRLVGMMDASNGRVGFGGGSRSQAQQEAEFLRRHVEDPKGPIRWAGKRWTLKPGMAPLAPPDDRSYHMPTIDGFALAADMTGDLVWANANCHRFMLRDFSKVGHKPEPWHFQPVEVPTARSDFNISPARYPLKVWNPPQEPQKPAEPSEDHRMNVVVGLEENHHDPRRWLWNGVSMRLLRDEAEFARAQLLFPLHPSFSTLQAPFWMKQAEIDEYSSTAA